ncbi:flagellar hook protein FlgE [Methylobacterium gregans]|uniref:Flagellar hook protein FlgE n=1 Tax=Methylobacterium gregans TaxID=374424 RepID=A0AA37MAT6_9HYPH|nr:flagellar hook protein FlgE [Methylobacterium gregans]MDQ0521011.1 flagellar hook protein FlgE [Methylobacterium gregans]GJD77939.1 Flagellar hook protein FlgE [Methylobacterium gregans]GLS54177.1 flagellar hook protein FlgE [Methylobacterium gregans]
MSLTGVLRTGVSGMNAQTNRISTVAENIQNASTTGYKRTSTEFSSLLLESSGIGNYNSGAVETTVRRSIGEEGPTSFTTSDTDLAINGNGFFLVRDGGGGQFLTRAGNFVKDGGTGNLVNAGGFTLLGYKLNPDGTLPANPALTEIKSGATQLLARPSSTMTLQGNLKQGSTTVTTPSATSFTTKTPVTTYDNLGNKVTYDVVFSKVADTATETNKWSVSLYTQDATPVQVGTANTITFGPTGQITGTSKFDFAASGDRPALALDLGAMTQLAPDSSPKGVADGSAPTSSTGVAFGDDGTVYTIYADGTRAATYKVPIADVSSPDQLQPRAGNVFEATAGSGNIELGFAQQNGLGILKSKALEQSNVDVATELTTMIESQSVYTANSKVFMTGNEMLETLMNLKR